MNQIMNLSNYQSSIQMCDILFRYISVLHSKGNTGQQQGLIKDMYYWLNTNPLTEILNEALKFRPWIVINILLVLLSSLLSLLVLLVLLLVLLLFLLLVDVIIIDISPVMSSY